MVHEINIFIHVTAGVLALVVGIVSFTSRKGSLVHVRAGRGFLGLIGMVLCTAAIGVLFFIDRPFLGLLTIQSLYMAASGYRATVYKKMGPGRIELMLVICLLACGGLFVWNLHQANILWSSGIIYYTLSVLFTVGLYDTLRIFKVLDWQHAWLPEHFIKMTTAYGALLSAGLGTLMPGLGPYTQILPSVLATMLILGVTWKYRKAFRGTESIVSQQIT